MARDFGLKLSVEKTKGMVVGQELEENDVAPVQVKGGKLDVVDNFLYLGSNISRDVEATVEIDFRIAKASRAFGCLQKPIIINLSLATKRQVYRAAVYCQSCSMEQRYGH